MLNDSPHTGDQRLGSSSVTITHLDYNVQQHFLNHVQDMTFTESKMGRGSVFSLRVNY